MLLFSGLGDDTLRSATVLRAGRRYVDHATVLRAGRRYVNYATVLRAGRRYVA